MNEKNLTSDCEFNTIDELKEAHDNLVQRIKEFAANMPVRPQLYCENISDFVGPKTTAVLSPECDELRPLLIDVDKFLKCLSEFSANPGTVENYIWICDTAVSLTYKLSNMLNVFRTIELHNAPSNLLPRLAPGDALSESELHQRVNSLAKIVYAYRLKDKEYNKNSDDDWHKAEIFLAIDIMDGTINFARRISSISYPRLERIWAFEMRELLAYLNWEKDDRKLFGPRTTEHYIEAWKTFEKKLRDPAIKATLDEFGEAKRYLEEHYVTLTDDGYGYRIDNEKLVKAGDLNIIKIKSKRIGDMAKQWNLGRKEDDYNNWLDAEKYVKMYYENIIPAIMGNTESAQQVIDAFDYSMKSGSGDSYFKGAHRIINAFEIILAIYFISIETIENIKMPSEQEINK